MSHQRQAVVMALLEVPPERLVDMLVSILAEDLCIDAKSMQRLGTKLDRLGWEKERQTSA
jgi:hypothetical protein